MTNTQDRPPAARGEPLSNSDASPPKVIIIGGGIAGLACGCYLQMNGIQSEILEASLLPGGLCTAWHRGPYVFDGCLRWLMGARPPSVFHQIWSELGAISGRNILTQTEVLRFESPDGRSVVVPADLDELEREFKRIAPEDSKWIEQLVRDARRSASLEPPIDKPVELMSPREKMRIGLRYLPLLPVIMRWKNISLGDYLNRYRSPLLRETLQVIAGSENMSALVLVMGLAFRTLKNTAFVAGGSWDFAMAIADRYIQLGGKVRYKARVSSIKVENNRAVGVECSDGSAIPAATVVSCADGYTTIFKMLDGRFANKNIRYLYEKCETFPALIQVSVGARKLFPDAPHTLSLPTHGPFRVDDQMEHHRMDVETFGADSALCPEGTTVMTARFPATYAYWTSLKKKDPRRYQAEKQRVMQQTISVLEQRFPGLAQSIEHADIATPATYERYTGNWQASYEGWLPTPRVLSRRVPSQLPGLKNFYMAGHWVMAGGGIPSAALSGRYAAHMICAQYGKAFTPTEPQSLVPLANAVAA